MKTRIIEPEVHPELEIVLSSETDVETSTEQDNNREAVPVDAKDIKGTPTCDTDGSGATDPESQRPINRILRPINETIVMPLSKLANQVGEQVAANTIGIIIPKIEKIAWRDFVGLSVIIAIPAVSYIVGFTKMGYGLQTFYFLSRYYYQHSYILALSIATFGFTLYLLDIYYWNSTFGKIARYTALSTIVLAIAVLVCFISTTFPYGPISLYIVLTPTWLVCAKHLFYRKTTMRTYIPWLSGPLFFNAISIMAIWIYWTFMDNSHEWTDLTRLADAQVSGCMPDLTQYPQCGGGKDDGTRMARMGVCFQVDAADPQPVLFTATCPNICANVYDSCPNMFIVWVGPFLVSLGLLFLSFFATFMKATGTIEQEALKFAKMWFFLLFAMWVASALAGAGAGVSVTLAALTLSAFVASAIMIAASFSHTERGEKVLEVWMNLVESYRQYLNVAKGLLVVTTSPVFLVYLAVSFLNQSIRNINLPCSKKEENLDPRSLRNVMGKGLVTDEARRLIREVKTWDLVDVFTYAIYWGVGFMVFAVLAAKFTVLFLSWLIEQTQDMSIPVVTGILIGVGVIMFLLPPVPGAPIYLTLGIIIVPVGRKDLGILYSIIYAMFVSLLLKLFATFLQQKMIGGLLKSKVGIRQMVGINTPLIRAFKLVLSEPGFAMAKVSILCGGPDWPTSVLCGIMDLSLWPILVGTLPVLILIIPTVLTGSFTYMAGLKLPDQQPEFTWAGTAATISAAFTAIVLFGFMLLAAYYVELTMRERDEDIKKIAIDEEVKEADDEQVLSNEVYKEATEWHLVPVWAKFMLIFSLVCMVTSCYMVQLFQEDAFTTYELTYTIDKHLQGDWKNLVKPLGMVSLLLLVTSIFSFLIFLAWAKRAAKIRMEKVKFESHLSHVDEDIGVRVYASGSI